MPPIPANTSIGFIGVILALAGLFLVLAGLGIIKIEKLSVTVGRKTWLFGIFLAIIGVGLMLLDVGSSRSQAPTPNSSTTGLALTPSENQPTWTPASVRPTAPTPTPTPMMISFGSSILFDETHSGLSLDPFRAATLVPNEPAFAYAGVLAKEIKKSYTLDPLLNGLITPEALTNYRVLILTGLNGWYSQQEIETILNFVRSGGGLLIIGEGGNTGSLDLITGPMGVSFAGGPIDSENRGDSAWDFQVRVNSTNNLLAGVSEITVHDGTAIRVDPPAISLLSTDANTWLDLNTNRIKDSNEESGPFTIAAQVQLGQGRVVIAPFAVWGNYFSTNATFLMHALEWLVNK
jgi:hypothetical protein